MNILSVTNALKEIKLQDLDDEFQINIMSKLNDVLPEGICITAESSGNDIRKIVDSGLEPAIRSNVMSLDFISKHEAVVRFFNNVEKVQQSKIREVEYDDAIKGNFISTFSFFVIICVGLLMGIYVTTEETRGKVPESKVLNIVNYAVNSLAEVHAEAKDKISPSNSE